ncbi:LLM class flavin-dependent oxidoreductase, partial [Streptomyces albidoflavus]
MARPARGVAAEVSTVTGPVGPASPSPATAPALGTGPFPGVRFSVLDRSRVREGRPVGEALRDTVELARE